MNISLTPPRPPGIDPAEAAWRAFLEPESEHEFFGGWLALQCRLVGRVTSAVLLVSDPRGGGFAPLGVWPDPRADVSALKGAAEAALRSRQGETFVPENAPPGAVQLAYPVMVENTVTGIVVLALAGATPERLTEIRRMLSWGVGWLEAHVWRERALADAGRIERAAIALDMLGVAEEQPKFKAATMALANALAGRLKLSRVAIGMLPPRQRRGGMVRIVGLSATAYLPARSPLSGDMANAMEEALDQNATLSLPVAPGDKSAILTAHAAYRDKAKAGAVASFVMSDKNAPVGAILIEKAEAEPFDRETLLVCEAVTALLGPILALKAKQQKLISGRLFDWAGDGLRLVFGRERPSLKIAAVAAIAAIAFVCLYDGTFRVSADAALEGAVQRSAVSPFAGFVMEAPKRAGDRVSAGEVLATLDERDLRLDELKWQSEYAQLERQRRRAQAEGDRAEAALLSAQMQQAEAQQRLAAEKRKRTIIRAPIDGVILSGDLSQKLGSPIEQGEVLFMVAPLDSYRVVLSVPETDLRHIAVGQTGSLLLSGIAGVAYPLKVVSITSVAAVKDGKNVFRVEAAIADAGAAVRPGMEGVAKIDIDERPLISIWTRRLIDWARYFYWTWIP